MSERDDATRDPAVEAELAALLREGHKIQAIKRLREHTGIGLKEAKDDVDALEKRLGLSRPPSVGSPGLSLIFWAIAILLGLAIWWFSSQKATAQELGVPTSRATSGSRPAR